MSTENFFFCFNYTEGDIQKLLSDCIVNKQISCLCLTCVKFCCWLLLFLIYSFLPGDKVWEDIPQDSKEFIKEYLKQYPEVCSTLKIYNILYNYILTSIYFTTMNLGRVRQQEVGLIRKRRSGN